MQGTVNGIGERTGNANLITIIADLQLKMGLEILEPERLARLTETAHLIDDLLNRTPNPAQPYVGKHAFAHKAGLHAAGVRAEPQTFEHVDPAVVGNGRDVLISELSGRGTIVEKAQQAGIAADEELAQRVVERVKELEHEGFQFEAADGSLELLMRKEAGDYEPLFRLESWRVIVEKHADGRANTEATVKIWLGGERYVRTAEGNGPVNALDRALRDAIGEIHPHLKDIDLVNYKVRILDEARGTGAVTRVLIDASDGQRVWGTIGVSGDIIAASWEALVDSLAVGVRQPALRTLGDDVDSIDGLRTSEGGGTGDRSRPPSRSNDPGVAGTLWVILRSCPLARPVLGEAEEQAVLAVLRSGQLSLGPRVPEFERSFAACVGAPLASAISSGTAALHLALRAVGVEAGDEVVTSPFSFVASANAALYERARPVFADIDPVTLNLDADAAAAAVTQRTRALLPVHIFGYPADLPAFERLAAREDLAIVEDACEALGAVHSDGVAVGGRGHPAAFGFYANKQLTTGEGGMVTVAEPELKARVDSERNQGRAPNMDWLDHDRLGFNYRLSDLACALGLAQLERLDGMLAQRGRVAGFYREALAGIEGLGLPCPDRGGERRGWFVFVVQLPHGVDRDETIRALGAAGIQSKPYLPAIHLMSFYRERFGHRVGEFPVCEDVAARSLALPFFPEMSEGLIARVSQRLVAVLDARRATVD